MKEKLSFDQLPAVISFLAEEVSQLKRLLVESNKKENQNSEEEFLSVNEVADFLNLSVHTIYSKVCRGSLPAMKQGKRLYFSRNELVEYLKQGKKKSVEELQIEAEIELLNYKKGA